MRRQFLICIILMLTTVIVFWQVGKHEFVNYDDDVYVTENPQVQTGLTRQSLIWAFTTTHGANWHPLTWLSHMLDCQLYGLNPRGHHLTNLLFHLANTLLLFVVLRRMTGALWQSGFVAALFALHPLHVESVAWVAERKDVLSGFFWLLTMWTYVRYVERPGPKRYILTFFIYGLGLMAKPMLVTLPFVLLLLDYWPLNRFQTGTSHVDSPISSQTKSSLIALVWEKLPLFALAAVSSVATFVVQQRGGAVKSVEVFPMAIRIANALLSYVFYVKKMVWPQGLAFFYPHPGMNLPMWKPVAAGLLMLSISISVALGARRHPYLLVGWLWYLGTLVPVIGLVQVGTQAMADRYSYLPLIGLFVIVAWGVGEFAKKWPHLRILAPFLAAIVLIGLSVCSWWQIKYWKNSVTLFEHTLRVTDNNSPIHNNLGNVLAQQGMFEEAVAHYTRALEIRPNDVNIHINLAVSLTSLGKLEEAIANFNTVLKIKPDHAEAYNNLGNALVMQGRIDEAVANYSRALEIRPTDAEAHNNLGAALAAMGKLREAIAHFSQALRFKPDYAEAHYNLGMALATEGKLQEAIAHFSQALRFKPDYAKAHHSFGIVLAHQGHHREAIDHFREAIKLKPDFVQAQNSLRTALEQVR